MEMAMKPKHYYQDSSTQTQIITLPTSNLLLTARNRNPLLVLIGKMHLQAQFLSKTSKKE